MTITFIDPAVYVHYFFVVPNEPDPPVDRVVLEGLLTAAYQELGGDFGQDFDRVRLDVPLLWGYQRLAPAIPRRPRGQDEVEAEIRTLHDVVSFRVGSLRRGEF